MQTYLETVNRYVVERMDVITDPARRAEYRINGVDPDDNWCLIWSFTDRDAAERQAAKDDLFWGDLAKHRVRDLGTTVQFERTMW